MLTAVKQLKVFKRFSGLGLDMHLFHFPGNSRGAWDNDVPCLPLPSLALYAIAYIGDNFFEALLVYLTCVIYDWSYVKANRNTRVLMKGSSSMRKILHMHSFGSFLARCCFCGSAKPVKLLEEQGSSKQGKGQNSWYYFFDSVRKRRWMPSNGWEKTGKNDWGQQNMTPWICR